MMLRVITFLLVSSLSAVAQYPWSGVLDSSRGVDWSQAGVVGGIPNRTVVCIPSPLPSYMNAQGVIQPSGSTGITDTQNINAALQACGAPAAQVAGGICPAPPGCVVQLAAGTFYNVTGITFGGSSSSNVVSNVTLRGAGPDQTFIFTMSGGLNDCGVLASSICFGGVNETESSGSTYPYSGTCRWTAGYARGSTVLTLDPTSCVINSTTPANGMPLVGYHIMLDQNNDDWGLSQCSSSGTTATCTIAGQVPLPSTFTVGACVGVGQMNNGGTVYATLPQWQPNTLYAYQNQVFANITVGSLTTSYVFKTTFTSTQSGNSGTTTPAWNTALTLNSTVTDGAVTWQNMGTTGYNVPMKTLRYTGSNSQTCNAITAVSAGPPATFSYTLPVGGHDIPTWNCSNTITTTSAITLPPWAASTTYSFGTQILASVGTTSYNFVAVQAGNSGSAAPTWTSALNSIVNDGGVYWQNIGPTVRYGCQATVDTQGTYMTGVSCVTADGNCPGIGGGGGMSTGRFCPDSARASPTCRTGEVANRAQWQGVTVTAVNGSQITVSPPLMHNNWRTEQQPGIFWFTQATMPHDDGVEDLSIDAQHDSGTSTHSLIIMARCYNVWLKNIRSLFGSRDHVWVRIGAQHVTIRDSYFFGMKAGGGTLSYGVEVDGNNTSALLENNIFQRVVSPYMVSGSAGGVFSYTYSVDDAYTQSLGYMMAGLWPNHAVTGWNLFEGNNTPGVCYDNVHGSLNGPSSHFRERWRGQNTPIKGSGMNAHCQSFANRGVNFIGNVIGTTPWQGLPYQINFQGSSACAQTAPYPAFCSGSTSQGGRQIPDDPLVISTMMRWGNYDVVTGASTHVPRWCAAGSEAGCNVSCTPNAAPTYQASCSELPQGSATFLPAITPPANQTLPNSFYLTSEPSWFVTPWGTPHWPPIGPDITGGNAPDSTCGSDNSGGTLAPCTESGSGMAYSIPAQLAFNNAQLDASYFLPSTVTSIAWTQAGNAPSDYITVTGNFVTGYGETFQLTGMVPSVYNGIYQVNSINGPSVPYYGSTNPTWTAGGAISYGTIRWAASFVNPTGETVKGASSRGAGMSTTCPTSGNCTMNLTPPSFAASNNCPGNGAGCTIDGVTMQSTGWNVYVWVEADPVGKWCRQNSAPIAPGVSWVQSTAIITGAGACVEPPLRSTATSTKLRAFLRRPISPPTCCTTVGTMTSPLVRVFNAKNYYGVGTLPPQPPTASLNVLPSTITAGGTATLSWNTGNAVSASIDNGIGSVAVPSGSQPVSPAATTTYTLTAVNANGSTPAVALLTVQSAALVPASFTGLGHLSGGGHLSLSTITVMAARPVIRHRRPVKRRLTRREQLEKECEAKCKEPARGKGEK